MSNNRDRHQMIDLLEGALDAFGADVSRWPDDVRARLEPAIDGNEEARWRMAEARALDKVLGKAPALAAARQAALVDRIVAKAGHQPRVVAATPALVRRPASIWHNNALAAGALAASLLLGIFAGQIPSVNALAQDVISDDTSSQQVAQGIDVDSLWDEDVL